MAGIFDMEAMKTCIASGVINANRFVNLHGTASQNTALKTTVIAADGVTRPLGIFAPDERSAIGTGDQARVLMGAQVTMLEVDGSGTPIITGDLLGSNAVARGVVIAAAVDATLAPSAMALAPATGAGVLIPVLLLNSPGATATVPASVTAEVSGATAITAANMAAGHVTVLVPNTSAAEIDLPPVADVPKGATILIKKTTSNAGTVTVDPDGTETIDGLATLVNIIAENNYVLLMATGDGDHEWTVIDASEFIVTIPATGNTTLVASQFIGGPVTVLVPNTAALSLILPAVADIPPGSTVMVKKTTSNVAVVTVDPDGSETINGHATVVNVTNENDWLHIVSTRDADQHWQVVSASPYRATTPATGNVTLVASQLVGGSATINCPNTAALSIFLPASALTPIGAEVFVQKTDAAAEIITLDGNASETIDGAATDTEMDANTDWTLLRHVATASNWVTVAKLIA